MVDVTAIESGWPSFRHAALCVFPLVTFTERSNGTVAPPAAASAPLSTTATAGLQFVPVVGKASDGGDLRDAHYQDFRAWLTQKYAEHGKTDTYFE